MVIMDKNKKKKDPDEISNDKGELPGNPIYPASEDIYSKAQREEDPRGNAPSNPKKTNKNKAEKRNEKDFNEDLSGKDLDVPGSELDDDQENIGSEDEENNYYSLGGDDHNDLEEDKGD
jgi:hypothetical protein